MDGRCSEKPDAGNSNNVSNVVRKQQQDELPASGSTSSKPEQFRMLSPSISVMSTRSTKELVGFSNKVGENFFKAKVGRCCRSTVAISSVVIFLFIGIITTTSLLIIQYRKGQDTGNANCKTQETIVKCLRRAEDVRLTSIPPEIKAEFTALERQIESQAKPKGIEASSFAVVYNDQLWWTFHVGKMNYKDSKSPLPNNDTPYPIASVTKLFTAVMLQKLLEDGVIKNIDDPISLYNSEFRINNPFNKEEVTFRQLLCMAASLPREAPCYPAEKYNFCPYNSSEMWKRISEISLTEKPNSYYAYSNLGYSILGHVLANLTSSRNYEHWIKERILSPLAMRNSGFNLRDITNKFPASVNEDGTMARIMEWGWLNPAAGMYSTINDLHKFVSMILESSNNTLMRLNSKRRLFQIDRLFPRDFELVALGCPFVMHKLKASEKKLPNNVKKQIYQTFFSRNGNIFGYFSNIIVFPDMKLATIGLSANRYARRNRFAQQIASSVGSILYNIIAKDEAKYKVPVNIDAYVGTYKLSSYWPMITRTVTVSKEQSDRLYITIEYFKAALTYVRPWVLKSAYIESRYCRDAAYNNGLYNDLYYFEDPAKVGGSKCPRFYMTGISATGHTAFERVE